MNKKRLSIYVCREKHIHTYMLVMLRALAALSDKLITVYAYDADEDNKREVYELSSHVFRADVNSGLHAFSLALKYLSWDEIASLDQAVFMDSELVGPVGSLELMLDGMSGCDSWTLACEYADNGVKQCPVDCSHLFAFEKSALSSPRFREFFERRIEFSPTEDELLTQLLSEAGFHCGYYLDTSNEAQYTDQPLLDFPETYLRTRGCPVFLKTVFTRPYRDLTRYTVGQPPYDLYTGLLQHGFDFDPMLEYLIQTQPQAELCKTLHLNYTLSADVCDEVKTHAILEKRRIALVMHLYYMDLLTDSLRFASSMPECADVYITTNSDEKKSLIEAAFACLKVHRLEVRVIPNRGRDVGSLLVGVRDVIGDYDYACFVHDKKTTQSKPGIIGCSFAYLLFENLLASGAYVANILALFEQNPRLGILSPPVPFVDGYFPVLGYEWGANFDMCVKMAAELGVSLPLAYDKEPVAPMGTCFWFRPKAFRLFYDRGWRFEDFPPEPNAVDGTLLHAVERLYPLVPQQLGYYPASVMTERFTRLELDNLRDAVRGYNRVVLEFGERGSRDAMQEAVREAFQTRGRLHGKWLGKLRRFIRFKR